MEMWLRPVAWNCPAYDAVYLRIERGKRVVRFVQITRAVEHDLKLQHCAELISALENIGVFVAEVVEILMGKAPWREGRIGRTSGLSNGSNRRKGGRSRQK
jgi:hypothetical protein